MRAFVPDHMGQQQRIFQGAWRVNSSPNGDEKPAARPQAGGDKMPQEGERKKGQQDARGVTQITDEQDPIAAALRRVYNDAATEPLPDDLSRLLSRLEAAEKDA